MSDLRYATAVRPEEDRGEAGWVLVNTAQAIYFVVWSALWISIALLVTALCWRRGPALALARRVWAPGLLAWGVPLVVLGSERVDFRKAHLFVANHQSWLDVPALFAGLPVPLLFIAKRELARVPFIGWYMQAMGMVFVERSARAAGAASVSQATDRLARGWSLLSFPEGTRSRDGRVHAFKSAGFAAAIEAGVPVVPIAVEGADRVLPPGGFRVRPGRIRLVVGDPIPTTGLTRDDRTALARRAQQAVVRLLEELS
jgi:1-acyl-sn-glycerol-3-phosphate acyltransferase